MSTRWRRGKKKIFLTEHLPVAVSVFSFRIEEGRYGFEEEVAVSSTASIVTTTTSSCSSDKIRTSNKNSSGSREWAQNEINELIAIWEEEEALYNVRHPDYSIKQKRNNALDRVRSQLESAGIFATTTEIQNKLHSLRVYYSSQRSKFEYSKKSGKSLVLMKS